jgi:phosphotransferase system enzyme I (PtsI)
VAGDVQAVPVLLGLGVEALSVAPQHLPAVQRLVRAVRYDATKALAREALSELNAAAVRRRAREWMDAHGSSSEPQNP